MLIEELMKDEYNAGKAEGRAEGQTSFAISAILGFLSDLAPVSDNLKSRIESIDDPEALMLLNKKAAKVASIEEFEQYLTAQNY